jgi:hypothetical protein
MPGGFNVAKTLGLHPISDVAETGFVSISTSVDVYNRHTPPRTMRIELTLENAAALAKYAALAGHTRLSFRTDSSRITELQNQGQFPYVTRMS